MTFGPCLAFFPDLSWHFPPEIVILCPSEIFPKGDGYQVLYRISSLLKVNEPERMLKMLRKIPTRLKHELMDRTAISDFI